MARQMQIRYRLIVACCLLLPARETHAQMETGLDRDSLRQLLYYQPEDTQKVKQYIRLGQQYESNLPDSALYYYDQARLLSEKLNYPAGIIRYINNYTAVLNVQGRFDESLRLNLRAVEIARRENMPDLQAKALINTGAVYQYTEKYEEAISYYLQALPALEKNGDPVNLSVAYSNLCGLYRNLRQSEKALSFGLLSKKSAAGNDYAFANACNNYGNALKDAGRIDEAIVNFNLARNTGRAINEKNIEETALIALGDARLIREQPASAGEAFRSALELATAIEDISGIAHATNGLAFSLFLQKDFRAAEKQLLRGIPLAEQYDQKDILGKMLLLMSDVQIAMGFPDRAQTYRARQDSVTLQLLNGPLLENIQELETKYGSEKKQRELLQKDLQLAQTRKDARITRNLLIGSAVGVGLLLIILAAGYRIYRQRQQLAAARLESLAAAQESIRLQSIVEGEQGERVRISQEMHDDMGSGLTRILFLGRMIPGDTGEKLRQASEGLLAKMNEIIWSMNNQSASLAELISEIRGGIAELPETAGIELLTDIPEQLPAHELPQAYRRNVFLAVREVIHNAVKYSGATEIMLRVSTGNGLDIVVMDNGRGFDPETARPAGNGLRNIHTRISGLGGKVNISSTGAGTTVRFSLPL